VWYSVYSEIAINLKKTNLLFYLIRNFLKYFLKIRIFLVFIF